jgi:FimV-like protein
MKTTERHRLKDNELAIALEQAQSWASGNSRTLLMVVGAIVVVGGGVLAYTAWTGSTDNRARAMLAEAMVIEEARVMPPGPPAGTTNDPNAIGGQQPGTYPTMQAKLEAAVPKFQAAADAFPTTDSGLTARYHLARALVSLGRFDDAITHYDRVIAGGNALLARGARLGKAEAQLRAAQYEPAIAGFKQLIDLNDPAMPAEALLMELARAYRTAGKTDDARKTLNEIIEKHSGSPSAQDARTELEKLGKA